MILRRMVLVEESSSIGARSAEMDERPGFTWAPLALEHEHHSRKRPIYQARSSASLIQLDSSLVRAVSSRIVSLRLAQFIRESARALS